MHAGPTVHLRGERGVLAEGTLKAPRVSPGAEKAPVKGHLDATFPTDGGTRAPPPPNPPPQSPRVRAWPSPMGGPRRDKSCAWK